jgi:hypothetical protein
MRKICERKHPVAYSSAAERKMEILVQHSTIHPDRGEEWKGPEYENEEDDRFDLPLSDA